MTDTRLVQEQYPFAWTILLFLFFYFSEYYLARNADTFYSQQNASPMYGYALGETVLCGNNLDFLWSWRYRWTISQ